MQQLSPCFTNTKVNSISIRFGINNQGSKYHALHRHVMAQMLPGKLLHPLNRSMSSTIALLFQYMQFVSHWSKKPRNVLCQLLLLGVKVSSQKAPKHLHLFLSAVLSYVDQHFFGQKVAFQFYKRTTKEGSLQPQRLHGARSKFFLIQYKYFRQKKEEKKHGSWQPVI